VQAFYNDVFNYAKRHVLLWLPTFPVFLRLGPQGIQTYCAVTRDLPRLLEKVSLTFPATTGATPMYPIAPKAVSSLRYPDPRNLNV